MVLLGETLAPLKSMAKLPLTSMWPGFYTHMHACALAHSLSPLLPEIIKQRLTIYLFVKRALQIYHQNTGQSVKAEGGEANPQLRPYKVQQIKLITRVVNEKCT